MADPLTTRLVTALIGVSAGIALVHHGNAASRALTVAGAKPGDTA
jgi:hypothetical protein